MVVEVVVVNVCPYSSSIVRWVLGVGVVPHVVDSVVVVVVGGGGGGCSGCGGSCITSHQWCEAGPVPLLS